jgi:hypothetical protein
MKTFVDDDIRATLRIAYPNWTEAQVEQKAREFEQLKLRAPSATPKQRAARTEKSTMAGKSIVVKSTAELFELVSKGGAKGMRVYMPSVGDLFDDRASDVVEVDVDAVERFLADAAGRAQDGTREPSYSPASFPTDHVRFAGDGHGEPISAVPQPYDVREDITPGGFTRVGPFAVGAPVDPNIPRPANFAPPTPGRNPADGPAAPVFKRAGGTSGASVARGTFANLVDQSSTGIVMPDELRERGV